MDEKVLDVLIERVETSAVNYELHKSDVWKECLESDKERLKRFVMKPTMKNSFSEIPTSFSFRYGNNVYQAEKINDDGKYEISWEDGCVDYHETVIKTLLRRGDWVIISKKNRSEKS